MSILLTTNGRIRASLSACLCFSRKMYYLCIITRKTSFKMNNQNTISQFFRNAFHTIMEFLTAFAIFKLLCYILRSFILFSKEKKAYKIILITIILMYIVILIIGKK